MVECKYSIYQLLTLGCNYPSLYALYGKTRKIGGLLATVWVAGRLQ